MQTNTRQQIDDREDLVPGMLLEIKDQNTGTWVVGMLLNVYDSDLHSGVIVNILRPDGTTVDIDCVYAEVYTAPNYNINHFCRTLQRYLHETKEKEALLMRGIKLCKDAPTFNKAKESSRAQAFVAQDPPLTVYIDPTKFDDTSLTMICAVGWLRDDINATPPQLCLATWKDMPLSGRTDFFSVPLETIDGELWITSCLTRSKMIAAIPENLKTVQKNLDLAATTTHSFGPKTRTVSIVMKPYPVKMTLRMGAAEEEDAAVKVDPGADDQIVTTNVDETLWFQMGWQPQTSISTYDPMFLAGTRWLKSGDEPDCWVFLANKQGDFKFVIIPMTKSLTYFTFQEACAKVQCNVTDLVSSSELLYIDGVIGRWTNELIDQFCSQHGSRITRKKRPFAPIRIVPTKMPVPK